jgi:predicted ATPase/transcriptional regulator with XRE-family HTH domain
MEEMVSFGHWLKLRRQAVRLTQAALASRVACSSELIGKLEADARRPSPLVAERLAQQLGVPPHQRATFVKVARGELRVDRLPPPALVPAWPDPTASVIHGSAVPSPATPLIGRETELAELGALLKQAACRLVTIVGPGGIGKTRLALAAATEYGERFAHGVTFVPLAALSSPAFLAPTILTALEVGFQGQRDAHEQLLAVLHEKQLLLVLDNFEPLLAPDVAENDAGVGLLTAIVQYAPGVTLLVTSRERLGMYGEWLFDLSGLSYPRGEPAEGVEGYAAVQLFLQRARQLRRQFTLAEGEARAVARICQLVEGLPLAIELAASGLRGASPTVIADVLAKDLRALRSDQRVIPERHRSIWATLEHSWRLLTADERQVLARLSVFRGGFEQEAAVEVAEAAPTVLKTLVDKSLLRWDGVAHYDLHELVRQYASEKLRGLGEEAQIRDRHLTYYLTQAEQAEPELTRPQYVTWRRRLNDELNNIRAALEWSLQRDVTAGMRLASALRRYWEGHSPLDEGADWLERLLHTPGAATAPGSHAKALTSLAWLNAWKNRYVAACGQAVEGLAIYRRLSDDQGVAFALAVLGSARCQHEGYALGRPLWLESLALYRTIGDTYGIAEVLRMLTDWESNEDRAQAQAYLEEGLALCRATGDDVGLSYMLESGGVLALRHGDYATAHARFHEALVLSRKLDITSVASVIECLGELALLEGKYEQARAYLEESVALCQRHGTTTNGLWALVRLGYVALRQGDVRGAGGLLMDGLQRFADVGNRIGVVYTVEGLASLAVAEGRHVRAVRLYAWANAMRRTIANGRPPTEQLEVDRDVATLRTHLDAATMGTASAEGQSLTLEQAIAAALERSSEHHHAPLTCDESACEL